MRQKLLRQGANKLSYEIRGIVKKARQLESLGKNIYWENIGDPIQKNATMPEWMKDAIADLLQNNKTFGYCDSKGVLSTREFLAEKNNLYGGAQISAEDILFFNGLGDAISKLYQFLRPTARIIGPSPAYSTHSSAEAAHANNHPITYNLDPKNSWLPDLDDLYLQVKYNTNIVAILIINPDNPTGMVYPRETLQRMVDIAREFNLFIVCDEIYMNVTYNGAVAHPISTIVNNDVPAISLKGISKEFPWPGSRCGWMEYYNRHLDEDFNQLCETLENAKMIEVCSTKLPQMSIPVIMQDPRYEVYRKEKNIETGERSKVIAAILQDIPYIEFNETYGAFYNTIIFKEGVLNEQQSLKIEDSNTQQQLNKWLEDEPNMHFDKRFVYNLLAAKGVCVVPISSFCSDLLGFRVTILEENQEILLESFTHIKDAIFEFIESA